MGGESENERYLLAGSFWTASTKICIIPDWWGILRLCGQPIQLEPGPLEVNKVCKPDYYGSHILHQMVNLRLPGHLTCHNTGAANKYLYNYILTMYWYWIALNNGNTIQCQCYWIYSADQVLYFTQTNVKLNPPNPWNTLYYNITFQSKNST